MIVLFICLCSYFKKSIILGWAFTKADNLFDQWLISKGYAYTFSSLWLKFLLQLKPLEWALHNYMIKSFRLFIIHEDHTYRFWSTWPFSCWIQSKKPWYPTAFFDFNYFCTSRFSNEFWMSYDIKYVGCADHQRETVTWGTAV